MKFLLTGLPRPQFTLRTFFIAITLLAVWLGYYANWIHQRREARKWIEAHPNTAPLFQTWSDDPQPELPWPLKLLGEEPLEYCRVSPRAEEKADPAAYQTRIAEITSLFPECYLVDTSEYE